MSLLNPMDDDQLDAIIEGLERIKALEAEIARLRLAIRRIAEQDATLSVSDGNVTVTMDATLTDEEREAIETAMNAYGSDNANPECAAIEETLWRLLERMR